MQFGKVNGEKRKKIDISFSLYSCPVKENNEIMTTNTLITP